jgi:hypothetical protein
MTSVIRNAIISGIVLGLIAGAVVWYLERFEMERMFAEINATLGKHADFDQFLKEKGDYNGNDGN